jgi:hypothetical protein
MRESNRLLREFSGGTGVTPGDCRSDHFDAAGLPPTDPYRCVSCNPSQILRMTSLSVSSSSCMSRPNASSKLGADDILPVAVALFSRRDMSVRMSFTIWSMYCVCIERAFLPGFVCSPAPRSRTATGRSGLARRRVMKHKRAFWMAARLMRRIYHQKITRT